MVLVDDGNELITLFNGLGIFSHAVTVHNI